MSDRQSTGQKRNSSSLTKSNPKRRNTMANTTQQQIPAQNMNHQLRQQQIPSTSQQIPQATNQGLNNSYPVQIHHVQQIDLVRDQNQYPPPNITNVIPDPTRLPRPEAIRTTVNQQHRLTHGEETQFFLANADQLLRAKDDAIHTRDAEIHKLNQTIQSLNVQLADAEKKCHLKESEVYESIRRAATLASTKCNEIIDVATDRVTLYNGQNEQQ